MKSIREIVDEVAAAYTIDTRCLDDCANCVYINSSGNKCAFGRFALHPTELQNELFCIATSTPSEIDAQLVPEVRGHPKKFWRDLQKLHDCKDYWRYSGLSEDGKSWADRIVSKYTVISEDNHD